MTTSKNTDELAEEFAQAAREADERIKRRKRLEGVATNAQNKKLRPLAPEKETGKYRCHVIHEGLGVQFDMLLSADKPGADLYHGATIRIGKSTDAAANESTDRARAVRGSADIAGQD